MKAGVYRGVKQVEVEDIGEPELNPDGVIIDVRACGICGSDLHMYASGTMATPGQVMGHEFAGEVVEVGDAVKEIAVGDRIVAMPLIPCEECAACERGEVELCVSAFSPGIAYGYPGGFAERTQIPRAKLGTTVFKMSPELAFESGALVEPVAVAVHTTSRAEIAPDDVVVILGLGPIGQLISQVLAVRGVKTVIGIDRSEYRRRWATERGVIVVDPGDDLVDGIKSRVPGGREIDHVFEVTGAPSMPNVAARLVRKGGTVVIVGVYDGFAPIDVSLFAVSELRVLGTSAYVPADFAEALRLLEAGEVKLEDVISETAPLADLPRMFEKQLSGAESMKAMIHP